jgi:hypothetical protein
MPRYRKKQFRRRGGRRGGPLRRQVYHGMKFMKETILKTTIQIPQSAGPSVVARKFAANFNDISPNISYLNVPAQTAIPALFGRYCITGVKWTFIPAYTQSSTSSAPTSRVCYAINRDPQDVLTSEADIIRQDDCKFTNSTRKFSVYVKNPKPAIAATAQQMTASGQGPQQYSAPSVGIPDGNQVAFTVSDNKWIWLPTRVMKLGDPPTSNQYPDHLGLDFVMTTNAATDRPVDAYYVYQTLYLALKEQD